MEVIDKQGSRVTVRDMESERYYQRNSSHLVQVREGQDFTQAADTYSHEDHCEESGSQEDTVESSKEFEDRRQATDMHTRPERVRKQPKKLLDYVQKIS